MAITSVMNSVPKVTVKTQRLVVTTGASGGPINKYQDYLLNLKMSMQVSGGQEHVDAVINSDSSGSAYCNYADIVVTDRVIWNSRVFDISNVVDVNNLGIYLKLQLVEALPSDIDPNSLV